MRIFIPEVSKILQAAVPNNYTGAALTEDYVSFKLFSHLSIVIQTGAIAGGAAAVTLKQATKVDGTGAKALGLDYVWTDKAEAGTLVKTAVVSDTFDLDTASSIWVIELDDTMLDVNNGFDCVALDVGSPGAENDYYSALYIPSELRYAQATPPAVNVD